MASVFVVLFHSSNIYNPGGVIYTLGHESVVVFFVLSGYVIAFVADSKEKTLKEYSVSRISRIWSVAIPAIILTMVADQVGFLVNIGAYPDGYIAWDYPLIRIGSSLLFLNEMWSISIQSFSNVPYWSLNYEVWYYVTFALLTYIKGAKRWVIFALVLMLLGPKILLLMPIWWLGVYIYRSSRLSEISTVSAYVLLIASLIGLTAIIHFDLSRQGANMLKDLVGNSTYEELAFSRYFLSDYVLALFVAAHFVALRKLSVKVCAWLTIFDRPIRYFSSFTFAIYLFHQPLLLLFSSFILTQSTIIEANSYWLILTLTLLSTWALGHFTERKKYFYKRQVLRFFQLPYWSILPFSKRPGKASPIER